MSDRPRARESNATQRPSGDQRGVPLAGPPNEVTCRGFEPSASLIQTSKDPERVELKANWRPFGEKAGSHSSRLDEMSGVGLWAAAGARVRGTRQMFVLATCCA